jgi:hypothetical protein
MADSAFRLRLPMRRLRWRPAIGGLRSYIPAIIVAAVLIAIPAAAEPDEVYSEKPAEAAARYLAARRQLEAKTDLSVETILARGPAVRGAVIEVAGRVAGRTTDGVGASVPLNFMLRPVGVREPIYIDATADSPLVRVGNMVHVLAQLPSDAQPLDHYVMREIVLSADLPESERKDIAEKGEEIDVAPTTDPASTSQLPVTLQADDVTTQPLTGSVSTGTAGNGGTPNGGIPNSEQALPGRPGTEFPDSEQWGTNEAVTTWMQWVMRQNGDLTQMQARLIVESVLYYSYKFTIDHRLVFAMIKYESNFSPSCRSHAGAMGLTQLMPGTASGLGVTDPWDIQQNIMGGVKYLSQQLYSFEGKGKSNYEQTILGLACYNAGPNAVKRAGGVPNITETRRYVKKVAELFLQLWQNGMP